MKRNPIDLRKEKSIVNNAITAIASIPNNIPAPQKHTYNFKGRKSSDIASAMINQITPENGTVGDPFDGSNAFGIAAVTSGFTFKGSELDNYTYSVNKVLFTKCSITKIRELFLIVQRQCMSTVMDLYATECCGQRNYISKLHFDPEGENGFEEPEYYHPTPHRDISNNETIIMSVACPICGKKRKIFENRDKAKIDSTNSLDTSRFPKHHLIENSRINITYTHDADLYNRNFTKRAQFALLTIQDSILTLAPSIERDVLEQCLVASLTLARTCQYGSGSEYIYQVMRKQAQEKNVWELFEEKVSSFIKFKETYSDLQFEDITSNSSKMQLTNVDYHDFLASNRGIFDVIYTDPPYTDQVPYLERSQLYRDWLHSFYDSDNSFLLTDEMLTKEVVITNALSRAATKSGSEQYYADINDMFRSFYDALKPNGRVVLTIKLGSAKYLLTLAEYIKLARKNGFEYIAKVGIDKKDPTLRKQAARKNTIANEMLVFFTKLDEDARYWYHNDTDLESEITKHLYKALTTSSDGVLSLTTCTSEVQTMLRKKYNILPCEDIQNRIVAVIKNNFSVAETSFVYIDTNRLYLSEEDDTDLFVKLYDIIPVIINKFDSEDGFTREDLYFEMINSLFDGNGAALDQIIESSNHEAQINILLDNYCTMDNNEKYILKKYSIAKSSDIRDISSMDGYEFEDLIKDLLIKKGFFDVIRIGGACDRGVDIMAKKQEGSNIEKYIIQCKRWLGNVGSTPIQRLHSMKTIENIDHAICVTTANYTSEGQQVAHTTGVQLINGSDLMDELNQYFPGKYYHAALQLLS